jgi:lipid-A-disaccharide synthase
MPGSRLQEVKGLLPSMLSAAKVILQYVPDVQFLIPRASTIDRSLLEEYVQNAGVPAVIGDDHVYDMMNVSTMAIAASGTATLETALMGLPTILIYRVAPLTYTLSKFLVHVKYIGLPNIISGREIVPELWQDEVTPLHIAEQVLPILKDKKKELQMRSDMAAVHTTMGEPGAVKRIAEVILNFVKEKSRS